jgi:uncharacterized repeat protein (TIGR01451 family)
MFFARATAPWYDHSLPRARLRLEHLEERITPAVLFAENFDGVAAGTLPAGWTASHPVGNPALWTTTNSSFGTPAPSAPNAAFSPSIPSVGDNLLDTPIIFVSGTNPQISFQLDFDLESGFDGGQLLISLNGGAFQEFTAAGGSFTAGGYNSTIPAGFGSPIGGQRAWSGSSGGYVTVTANLPAVATPGTVRFRWRVATDVSNSNVGMAIDNVLVTATQVDLSVTNSPSPIAGPPGAPAGYTVTVSNAGPDSASGASVVDNIPAGLLGVSFSSVAIGGATGNTAFGFGNIHDTVNMPPGSSITYTISGTISLSALGTLTDTAIVAPAGGLGADTSPTNNIASGSILITPTADLAVSISDSVGHVTAGRPASYAVILTNNGPNGVATATLRDSLPAGLTGVTFTPSAGSYNPASGVWTGLSLFAGQHATLMVHGIVAPGTTGTLASLVTVSLPLGTELNSTNDMAVNADVVLQPGLGPALRTLISLLSFNPQLLRGYNFTFGDVTGDGITDMIVAGGAGKPPLVSVVDGETGQLVWRVVAFPGFNGGVRVSVADINGDGIGDVIASAAVPKRPRTKVFDGPTGGLIISL